MSKELRGRPERSGALTALGVAAWASIALSLALIFFVARRAEDAMGGELQRIFYFHVPSAWIAYLAFAIEERQRLGYGHVQHVRDRTSLELHFENFSAVATAVTVRAAQVDV